MDGDRPKEEPEEVDSPPGGAPEPPAPGSETVRAATALSRRGLVALAAALLLLGSCGVSLAMLRLGERGSTQVSRQTPGPSASVAAAPSPTASASDASAPDLVVSELLATSVTVTNAGEVPAGRFVVTAGDRAFVVEALEPNASATSRFVCVTGLVTAVADSTGRVDEADETNNERTAGPFDCTKSTPSASPSVSPSTTPSNGPTDPPSLPDLVVRRVSSDRTVVANVGHAPAGRFSLRIAGVGTFVSPGLPAGATFSVAYACTVGPLSAVVDAGADVDESVESNNAATGGPFTCLPDLVVADVGPDSVTVANVGRGDAGASVVVVAGQALSVGPLSAGQRTTIAYPCVGQDVTAVVDPRNQVTESDETNNQLMVDVGPCPP